MFPRLSFPASYKCPSELTKAVMPLPMVTNPPLNEEGLDITSCVSIPPKKLSKFVCVCDAMSNTPHIFITNI